MKVFFVENQGLYADEELITDFEPKVIGIQQHISLSDGMEKRMYQVMVRKRDGSETAVKEVDSLLHISYFDMWGIPDCMLSAKQKKILQYKLQQDVSELAKEQTEYVIEAGQGLYYYRNSHIYSFGNKVFTSSELETRVSIINKPEIPLEGNSVTEWAPLLKDYINFLPGVSEMLFYGSLFGAIKPILCDMGINPDFVISLVGPSGHLKTSMVRKYALWLEDSERQEVSFRDSRRNSSITAMIDEIPGQNFLIDDLHEAKASDVVSRQQEKLDLWVRHVGMHKNSANVFITGETMKKMGIFSCKDRILQIAVPRMKSENLRELKQKIGMLPNGYMGNLAAVFLKKLMKNYDEVKVIIKDFLEQNLNKTVGTYDTRTYHHGVFIKLTEVLFRKYMCGGLSNWSETAVLNVAIEKNCRIQQKDLQRECDIDYTLDVYDMLTSNDKYLIAKTDRFQYDPRSNTNYYFENSTAYVTREALVYGMGKYYDQVVSWKKIVDDLDEKAVLEEDTDKRTKKFMEKRHYVIRFDVIQNYKRLKEM